MYAEILAIGPFRRELVGHYEYPPEQYAQMREGAPIVRTLFGIVEGTYASTALAGALGLADAWDFNHHKLDLSAIDLVEVERVLSGLGGWQDEDNYRNDLEALRAFVDAKYDLYYLPNG